MTNTGTTEAQLCGSDGRELGVFSGSTNIYVRLVAIPVYERHDDKEVTDDDGKCCLNDSG